MVEKLFSYGTLQLENVQLENFGRKLVGSSDLLRGYEIKDCIIKDPEIINISGKSVHPMACYTSNFNDIVRGMVLEVTFEELQEADRYEVDDYKRIKRVLNSGEQAWVYVQSGLNIDATFLEEGPIKLEIFEDHHIPMLSERAQDSRIWQHHRIAFHNPDVFESIAIAKAKEGIADKTRYMFVIYYQDQIIGSTSYYDVNLNQLKMHIGYSWIHPNYWGKGINQTIKKLMLSYAFDQLKFKRVAFCIDSENLRSRGAVEKLGIPFEGILRKHQIRADGSSRDSVIYAVTDEVWKSMLGPNSDNSHNSETNNHKIKIS